MKWVQESRCMARRLRSSRIIVWGRRSSFKRQFCTLVPLDLGGAELTVIWVLTRLVTLVTCEMVDTVTRAGELGLDSLSTRCKEPGPIASGR